MKNLRSAEFTREHGLAVAIYKAGDRLKNELEAGLSPTAVDFLQLCLLVSVAIGSASSPAGIARQLNVDPSMVTRALDKLQARELVERKRSAQDRRSRQISLTETGLATLVQLCDVAFEVLGARLGRVSEEKYSRLHDLMTLIVG
jgi:DNA-binding MarR family transcriptional regulator